MSDRPPVQFAETPREARRLMNELYREAYLAGRITAVDTEFVPVTHEPVLMSYSWGRGIRRVVRAELVKEFFGDWLVDPQTKVAYQNYKEDAETMGELGIPEAELVHSFYIDVMITGVLRDETLVLHGLKAQMLHFLKWFRREYKQTFCYVPPGKKKPIVMNPRQVMDDLPRDALAGAVLKWAGGKKPNHKTGERDAASWRQLMLDYAGDDAEGTQILAVDHRRYLKKTGYWDRYVSIDREFTITLMQCEDAGAMLDQPILRQILRKQEIRIMRAERCFRAAAGNPNLNLRSPPQMKKLLFDEWGWPEHPSVETDSGGVSMDKEVLNWWVREHKLEMAEVKLAYNNATTMRGTFLIGLLKGVSDDGRLRSDLNQIGGKTSGRISSRKFDVLTEQSKTLKDGTVKTWIETEKVGANLQNIPARKEKDPDGIRGAFRAPWVGETTAWGDKATEPHKLLVADYSGFHLVLVIHFVSKLTKESAMLDIMKKYKTPSAVHVYTTIQMFKHAKPHRCTADACKDKETGEWKKYHGENKVYSLKEFTMDDWKLVKPLFPDQYTYSKNCVTGETMILTDRGYLRIDELCAGAPIGRSKPASPIRIVTRDGIREVADLYRGGKQPVKKLTTELGFAVRANDSHDMPVVRGGKIEMVKVADMVVGDLCVIKFGSDVHGSTTRLPSMEQGGATCYKPVALPQELTPEVARLLGYFVSEGYSTKSNTTYYTSFGFGFEDDDMVLDFEHCLRSVVGSRLKSYEDEKARRYSVTSKDLYEWWRFMGCGESSADKQIPPCVLAAPWSIKREFLRAYFAGDGSIYKGTVKATSKSELLIRQLQGELVNVGIACSVFPGEVKGYGTYWSVQISNSSYVRRFASIVGFTCQRKQQAAERSVLKTPYSTLILEGFDDDCEKVHDKLSGDVRARLSQVIRGASRLGEVVVRKIGDEALRGTELEKMLDDGLWTVRVTSIEPDGEAEVFDLYEPIHKMMVASGLLVGDTNFALIFLGSPWTLAYNTGRDANDPDQLEECKRHFDDWYDLYPEVPVYQNHMIDHGREHGWVPTIGGRRGHVRKMLEGCDRNGRYIQDEEKRKKMIKHGERVATNVPAQGSEADIVKDALNRIRMSKKMVELRARPLFPVHDEIVCEGPEQTSMPALDEQIRLMKEPYKEEMEVELAVEGGIGDNWILAKP